MGTFSRPVDMLKGRFEMPQLNYMEKTKMEQQEVKKALLKLKDGKQLGPNKIKGEIYKWMASSNTCVDGITKAMNLMMENGRVPAEWKKSRIVMIPKAKKNRSKRT